MRRRSIISLILTLFATAIFIYPRLASTTAQANVFPQTRPKAGQARRARNASARNPAPDYARFSHRSRSHQQACNSCHQTPTNNWRAARGFPDVADYPDHASCVSCHRQQFFNGARPAICTICHTNVSPRDEARFAFRNPAHARQFTDIFPHDKHQDVIAEFGPTPMWQLMGVSFAPVNFDAHGQQKDLKTAKFNNCAICHATRESGPAKMTARVEWPDSFVPTAGTFKSAPTTHASCFNCHWQGQEPTKDNCAGCHKAAAPYFSIEWPPRISIKFTHAREQHIAECTTCHINITRANTLRGLKPDVPISSCAPCHKTSTNPETLTIEVELDRRQKDSGYACMKCHTTDVGRKVVPLSHTVLLSQ